MNSHPILERLLEGNRRYSAEKSLHPNRDKERRAETAAAQNPFAVILSCSDSRVASEIIFDQGIGDLFIVRVAGNVVGPLELSSIEFAVHQLGVELVFVVGHENCGAIQAVVSGQGALIAPIANLIQIGQEQTMEQAVKHNVLHVVQTLQKKMGEKAHIAGGYYQLSSGLIEVINS